MNLRAVCFGGAAVFALSSFADVLINEVQSSNDKTCVDENGENADWVELYNNGQEDVDLSGWGLSDKESKPYKWAFPEGTVIKAGGYLRVFADDSAQKDEGSESALSPDDISLSDALVGWFSADNALSTYGENAPVISWSDMSGRGNHATNVVAANCPVVVPDVANGHAALSFTAAQYQQLLLPKPDFNGLSSMSNVTVIIAGCWSGRFSDTKAKCVGLFGLSQEDGAFDTYFQIYYDTGLLRIRTGSSKVNTTADNVVPKNRWGVMSFATDCERETPQVFLYYNDGIVKSNTPDMSGSCFVVDGGILAIGNTYYDKTDAKRFFDGYMSEVIIYNRALLQSEYKRVYRYLAEKYNISAQKNLRAKFSLSASGETLTLTDVSGNRKDTLAFGKIPCDCSYGRFPDGGDSFRWFAEATPNGANAEIGYDAPADGVSFSVTRGVYSEPITLRLSHPSGGKIVYTTDHSDPTETKGIVYSDDQPINIERTTTVKATVFVNGALPYRNVATHTYLFLKDVFTSEKPDIAPMVWSDVGSTPASYAISESVVFDEQSKSNLIEAISAAPIVSLTVDDAEMFDPNEGLYCNPSRLEDMERTASVEWLSGKHVFGSDVGLCINGGWSRRFNVTPKKSFRLKFRGRFGASKLEVPVMDDVGYELAEFKTLVLRAENNNSWPAGKATGTSMHDQFIRDLQGAMSGYQSHGTHVQLFINGLYWGLYNLSERADANFATTQWGGSKGDYDAIVQGGDTREVPGCSVRDGTDTSYLDLQRYLQTADLTLPESYEYVSSQIDLDSFADYMMLQWYISNSDWPDNNWISLQSSVLGVPLRYVVWDAEYSLAKVTDDIVQKQSAYTYTPQAFQRALERSDEYRLRFADRVHKHFFNDGVLTVAAVSNRYATLAARVRPMVFGEVARWGAYRYDFCSGKQIFTMATWDAEYRRLTRTYFPGRRSRYLELLKNYGLYPGCAAPEFTVSDGALSAKLSIPAGATVYYTTDGSDPRVAYSGAVAGVAAVYAADAVISVQETSTIKARARSEGGEWSALSEVRLEGAQLVVAKNEFLPTGNGENWDKASNWSLGFYPQGPGASAFIGAPTAVKEGKGWRNIHINKNNVTVGLVEVSNGGWTNRIDTGKSGNLIFSGATNEFGEVAEDAKFIVVDECDAGLTMVDLDAPNRIELQSTTTFVVSNSLGDANYGGLYLKGLLAGNGCNLVKSGPGRLTLGVVSVDDCEKVDKVQCEEGIVAFETPMHVGSITKAGPVWLKMAGADAEIAAQNAVACDDKLSADAVCLFVPTAVGGQTFYGGVVASNSLTKAKKCTAYVLAANGPIKFCGKSWQACDSATISTTVLGDGRLTYQVSVPRLIEETVPISPSESPTGIEVAAETAKDAIALLEVIPPVGSGGMPVVSKSDYASYFKWTAQESALPGSYRVKPELNPEVVSPDESLTAVADALFGMSTIAAGEDCNVEIPARPGLYYSILATSDLLDGFEEGERLFAEDDHVNLPVPKCGESGFYKIKVSISGEMGND